MGNNKQITLDFSKEHTLDSAHPFSIYRKLYAEAMMCNNSDENSRMVNIFLVKNLQKVTSVLQNRSAFVKRKGCRYYINNNCIFSSQDFIPSLNIKIVYLIQRAGDPNQFEKVLATYTIDNDTKELIFYPITDIGSLSLFAK